MGFYGRSERMEEYTPVKQKMIMKPLFKYFSVLMALFFMMTTSCNNNSSNPLADFDPATTNISNSIAQDVGYVSHLVTNDVSDFNTILSENILFEIQESLGFFDPGRPELQILFAVDAESEIQIFDRRDQPSGSTDLFYTEACAVSGNKVFSGTMTVQPEQFSSGGTASGTYTVSYESCVDTVEVKLADGFCTVEVDINGTLLNESNFRFFDIEVYNPQQIIVSDDITSDEPLNVRQNNQITDIEFDFSFEGVSTITSLESSGVLIRNNQNFLVTELSNYLAVSDISEVCPSE
jgi:hypothetical protein